MNRKEKIIIELSRHIDRCAHFDDEDKKIWKEKVSGLAPDFTVFLLYLFENSPKDILVLKENIKAKKKILEQQNEKEWQRLIDKEEIFLKQIFNN